MGVWLGFPRCRAGFPNARLDLRRPAGLPATPGAGFPASRPAGLRGGARPAGILRSGGGVSRGYLADLPGTAFAWRASARRGVCPERGCPARRLPGGTFGWARQSCPYSVRLPGHSALTGHNRHVAYPPCRSPLDITGPLATLAVTISDLRSLALQSRRRIMRRTPCPAVDFGRFLPRHQARPMPTRTTSTSRQHCARLPAPAPHQRHSQPPFFSPANALSRPRHPCRLACRRPTRQRRASRHSRRLGVGRHSVLPRSFVLPDLPVPPCPRRHDQPPLPIKSRSGPIKSRSGSFAGGACQRPLSGSAPRNAPQLPLPSAGFRAPHPQPQQSPASTFPAPAFPHNLRLLPPAPRRTRTVTTPSEISPIAETSSPTRAASARPHRVLPALRLPDRKMTRSRAPPPTWRTGSLPVRGSSPDDPRSPPSGPGPDPYAGGSWVLCCRTTIMATTHEFKAIHPQGRRLRGIVAPVHRKSICRYRIETQPRPATGVSSPAERAEQHRPTMRLDYVRAPSRYSATADPSRIFPPTERQRGGRRMCAQLPRSPHPPMPKAVLTEQNPQSAQGPAEFRIDSDHRHTRRSPP